MIKKISFLWLLFFAAAPPFVAQEKPKLQDCEKYSIQDSEKRDFNDRESFTLDADGDGKADTVTTRIYTTKANRRNSGVSPGKRELHWIAFDLKTAKGVAAKSFFKYNYGTNEADLYVYALLPCRINGNGKTALLFYAGDEEGDETVILVQRGNRFKVYSRKAEW